YQTNQNVSGSIPSIISFQNNMLETPYYSNNIEYVNNNLALDSLIFYPSYNQKGEFVYEFTIGNVNYKIPYEHNNPLKLEINTIGPGGWIGRTPVSPPTWD